MTKLGAKLQNIITEYETLGITTTAAQHSSDLDELRKKAEMRKVYLDACRDNFIRSIEQGKIPYIKETDFNHKQWWQKAKEGKAEFQSLYQDFIQHLKSEGMTLNTSLMHDGGGMEDWLVLTLMPSKSKTRSLGQHDRDSRPPTFGSMVPNATAPQG